MLGASFDTPAENRDFAASEGFGYRLLSDPDREAGRTWEVLVDPADPAGGLARRIAYLIDPEGVIRRAYEVTDTAGFADAVLADLAALQGRP